MSPHPITDPSDSGHLHTAEGNEIYWEVSGNPQGIPALFLHGGPGSGLRSGRYRGRFDPASYRIVGIDQRGCGRSLPLAADALELLPLNTTQALIEDIEAVRTHLDIGTWIVSGLSWGSTLALAYAQAHPHRVRGLVLVAVTTTGRQEVDWITEGIGCFFPEAWSRFAAGIDRRPGEGVVDAYARRLSRGERQDRMKAAAGWNAWEDTIVSLDPGHVPASRDETSALNIATLVTHYWSHVAFLPGDEAILRRMPLIAHIPAVLIHGRRDMSGPSLTPWSLHRGWPASRLCIIESEGHGGPQCMAVARHALDAFAREMEPGRSCPPSGTARRNPMTPG